MTPEHFSRVRRLFDRAMDMPTEERRRFVELQAPPGDPVRDELLSMVTTCDDSGFLARACMAGVLDQAEGRTGLPSQIGPYKILRTLGRGGMGVVYMALRSDDVFQKVVALKVIGDVDDSPEVNLVQRFKQERQILAELDHPNIARILDGGSTPEGRPFYVMEYVAGSPIDEYCTRMNTDFPTRIRMMAQVCDAVAYLHNHAIAHRDIKPQNILVALDGTVKLVDFGIAKVESLRGLLNAVPAGAQPTMIMTPGYASPEQIAGDPSGKAGDIYSVAVVLYQLLTGRLPHAREDGRADLDARMAGTPPEPPSRELTKSAKTTPRLHHETTKLSIPDLDKVVLTALERDPLHRYGSAQLFGEDLRRCLDGRPIIAGPGTVAYKAKKLLARNRAIAAIAAAALLTAAGGVWMLTSASIENVRLDAREQELERFVDMLAKKVANWQTEGAAVPVAERVADVRSANEILSSETMRTLADQAADPPRVKRAMSTLGQVLARADTVSQDQPALRKEIALVYRRIGDIGSSARVEQLADRNEAAQSYRRAAAIVAAIRPAERDWAEQQLAELSGRMATLGVTLDAAYTEEAVAAEPEPPAEPAAPVRRATRGQAAPADDVVADVAPVLSPEEIAARDAVQQRLRVVEGNGTRARGSFEMLRNSLASRGQAIRPDIESMLVSAEQLIEDARASLDANDVTTAEDSLRRAGVQLDRVFQAVGR